MHTASEERTQTSRMAQMMTQVNPLVAAPILAFFAQPTASPLPVFRPWVETSQTTMMCSASRQLPYPLATSITRLRPHHLSVYTEDSNVVFVVNEARGTEEGVETPGGKYVVPEAVIRKFLAHEKLAPGFCKLLKKYISEEDYARLTEGASAPTAAPAAGDNSKSKLAAATERATSPETFRRTESRNSGAGVNVPFPTKFVAGDYSTATTNLAEILTSPHLQSYLVRAPVFAFEDCDEVILRDLVNAESSRQFARDPNKAPKVGRPQTVPVPGQPALQRRAITPCCR